MGDGIGDASDNGDELALEGSGLANGEDGSFGDAN